VTRVQLANETIWGIVEIPGLEEVHWKRMTFTTATAITETTSMQAATMNDVIRSTETKVLPRHRLVRKLQQWV
jgi:hypothetical protein